MKTEFGNQSSNYAFFFEREIRKEVRRKERRLKRTHEEIKSVVQDLTHFEEENRKLEKVGWSHSALVRYSHEDQERHPVRLSLSEDIFILQ